MPPNMPMQPTAFGAQDRCFFEIILCGAPRRRLMGGPFGGFHLCMSIIANPLLCYTSTI
jgi:hypothetical protein